MEPTGQIPIQPWMAKAETRAVMAALKADDGEARFIGGCVRDSILKRPIKDIDIATPQPPELVMEKLERAGIRAIPTGLDHGTVTAVIEHEHYEITTLRIDVETDGRRAKVAFTDDWTMDAARRDFTMNALSCDEDGNIYDPFDGLEDLGNRRVRFVGNAAQRVDEDVLRLLRFFRFHAEYGGAGINRTGLQACRTHAHRLPDLSGERVRGELFRIFMAPHPADTIQLMRGEGVLKDILPEAQSIGRLRMIAWLTTTAVKVTGMDQDPVRRLAAVLKHDATTTDAETIADRLKFSNLERKHLKAMVAPPQRICPDLDAQTLRRLLNHHGKDLVIDWALLVWADDLAQDVRQPQGRNAEWTALIERAEAWTPIPFPLHGRDALDVGIPHGPTIGAALKQVEQWWTERDFQDGRDSCLERLHSVAKTVANK